MSRGGTSNNLLLRKRYATPETHIYWLQLSYNEIYSNPLKERKHLKHKENGF